MELFTCLLFDDNLDPDFHLVFLDTPRDIWSDSLNEWMQLLKLYVLIVTDLAAVAEREVQSPAEFWAP